MEGKFQPSYQNGKGAVSHINFLPETGVECAFGKISIPLSQNSHDLVNQLDLSSNIYT